MNHPDYLDDLDRAETLLEKINQQHAEMLTQYHITQVQFNFSYQFGLAKLSKTTLYDYKKTPKSSLGLSWGEYSAEPWFLNKTKSRC